MGWLNLDKQVPLLGSGFWQWWVGDQNHQANQRHGGHQGCNRQEAQGGHPVRNWLGLGLACHRIDVCSNNLVHARAAHVVVPMGSYSTVMACVVLAQEAEELGVVEAFQHPAWSAHLNRDIWQAMHGRMKGVPKKSMEQDCYRHHRYNHLRSPTKEAQRGECHQQDAHEHLRSAMPWETGTSEGIVVQDQLPARFNVQGHVIQRLPMVLHMSITLEGIQFEGLPHGAHCTHLVQTQMLEVTVIDILSHGHDGIQGCKPQHSLGHPHGKSQSTREG
mmetsp:Transcript_16712/g.20516  ORF Transcript_16712/g.20516 Transcript_16712/m.20516 type:complete len:275 (-) Transcript_16712:235-1059(-)